MLLQDMLAQERTLITGVAKAVFGSILTPRQVLVKQSSLAVDHQCVRDLALAAETANELHPHKHSHRPTLPLSAPRLQYEDALAYADD